MNADFGEFARTDREPLDGLREQPFLVYLQKPSGRVDKFFCYGCFEPTAYPQLFSERAGRLAVHQWEVRWTHPPRREPISERSPAGEPGDLPPELRPALSHLGGRNLRLPAGEPENAPPPNARESLVDSVLVLEFIEAELRSPDTDGSSPVEGSVRSESEGNGVAQSTFPVLGPLTTEKLASDEGNDFENLIPLVHEFAHDSLGTPSSGYSEVNLNLMKTASSTEKSDPLFQLDRLLERYAKEGEQESGTVRRKFGLLKEPLQRFLPLNDDGGLIALENVSGTLVSGSPLPLGKEVPRQLASSYGLFQAFEVSGESTGTRMPIADPLTPEPTAEQPASLAKSWGLRLLGITAIALGLIVDRSPVRRFYPGLFGRYRKRPASGN